MLAGLQQVAPADSGVLFCNPLYGKRLGRDSDLGAFYKQLGNVLKQRFTAIADQTSHKKKPESVASQHFQVFSWLGFERKAL